SATADYHAPIDTEKQLIFGMAYRYRDAYLADLGHLPESQGGPASIAPQNLVDVYVGLGIKNSTVRLYGTNVLNDKSYPSPFGGDLQHPQFLTIRPRTIGLSLDYVF